MLRDNNCVSPQLVPRIPGTINRPISSARTSCPGCHTAVFGSDVVDAEPGRTWSSIEALYSVCNVCAPLNPTVRFQDDFAQLRGGSARSASKRGARGLVRVHSWCSCVATPKLWY